MTEREKTLSIVQACALARVSRRTIYNWINTGKVKYVRTAGGSIRIFQSSLFVKGNVTPLVPDAEAQPHV